MNGFSWFWQQAAAEAAHVAIFIFAQKFANILRTPIKFEIIQNELIGHKSNSNDRSVLKNCEIIRIQNRKKKVFPQIFPANCGNGCGVVTPISIPRQSVSMDAERLINFSTNYALQFFSRKRCINSLQHSMLSG